MTHGNGDKTKKQQQKFSLETIFVSIKDDGINDVILSPNVGDTKISIVYHRQRNNPFFFIF